VNSGTRGRAPDRIAPSPPSFPVRAAVPLALLVLFALVAVARVVATYPVFSETADEHHFVAGIEWWDRGAYTYTIFHPPLARIASALPLYLAGARSHGMPDPLAEKNAILYRSLRSLRSVASAGSDPSPSAASASDAYVHNLALARAGILPFLVLGIAVVWLWGRRLGGEGAGLLAALLFSTLPPVLAHAGLTTTDMALTATFPLALFAFCLWLEDDRPSRGRTVFLGIAGALAILSKFSVVPLFVASVGAILIVRGAGRALTPPLSRGERGGKRRALSLLGAGAIAALLIWAAYRFSWGPLPAASPPLGRTVLHGPGAAPTSGLAVPAPELWEGMRQIRESVYVRGGHPSYLLGRYSRTGLWYYFPIALAVKTPLAFLLLAALGTAVLLARNVRAARRGTGRADWRELAPATAAAGVLVSSLFSRTDIGVRHILPIYPLLAVAAACGLTRAWSRLESSARAVAAVRVGIAALVVWQLADSARAHPDYLAHFNELAGREPDRVLLDSNLDWGQDLLRLSDELRARRVGSVALAYFGNAELSLHGLPPIRPIPPDRPTTGWVAISEMCLKDVAGGGRAYGWLKDRVPIARVGRSIRLYYFEPEGAAFEPEGAASNPR